MKESTPPSNDSWACSACSYLNVSIVFPICEMCHSNNCARIGTTTTVDWLCPVCTFNNDAGTTQCDACGSTSKAPSTNTVMIVENSWVTHVFLLQMMHEIPGTTIKLQRFLSTTVHSLPASKQKKKDELEAEFRFNDILGYCQKVYVLSVWSYK